MLLDAYGPTDSTPVFEKLSEYPLRFHSYLTLPGEEDVITCFRDAVLGQSKIAAWYV